MLRFHGVLSLICMQNVERRYYDNGGCVSVNTYAVPQLGFREGPLGGRCPSCCAASFESAFLTVLWRLISFKQEGQNDPAYAVSKPNILVVCFICDNSCKASHCQMHMVSETSSIKAVFETNSVS